MRYFIECSEKIDFDDIKHRGKRSPIICQAEETTTTTTSTTTAAKIETTTTSSFDEITTPVEIEGSVGDSLGELDDLDKNMNIYPDLDPVPITTAAISTGSSELPPTTVLISEEEALEELAEFAKLF